MRPTRKPALCGKHGLLCALGAFVPGLSACIAKAQCLCCSSQPARPTTNQRSRFVTDYGKRLALLLAVLFASMCTQDTLAQPLTFTTLAGQAGKSGSVDGVGTNAVFDRPIGIAADNAGNVYVADYNNGAVRRITSSGLVSTFAVGLPLAADVAVDANNNVFVLTSGTVFKLTPEGTRTTVLDNLGNSEGIALDSLGNLYISHTDDRTIWKRTPAGVVTTIAGGVAYPRGIDVDINGSVYVAGAGNHTIWRITPAGVSTVFAGSPGSAGTNDGPRLEARFNDASFVAVDAFGNLFFTDRFNYTIRKITASGIVSTVAGSPGVSGSNDGTGGGALFAEPGALALDSLGNLYVTDVSNNTVRKASTLALTTQPQDVTVPSGTDASFTVVVEANPPLFFQWLFNSTNVLIEQTNATMILRNVTFDHAGSYSVSVSNSLGWTTTSSNATLVVLDSSDTDGDGIMKYWEVQYGLDPTNPLDAATFPSGDRLTYLLKYRYRLDPRVPDNDGDGLSDYDELFFQGTDPLERDTDGDGIPDGIEREYGLNPRVNDANEDLDLDGLTNLQEFQKQADGYRVNRADSLGDGRSDYERFFGTQTNRFYYDRTDRLIGADYNHGSSGFGIAYVYDGNGNLLRQKNLVRDANTNGLPDVWEFLHGLTNNASAFADTDGDGWSDYQEWMGGTDPNAATSWPGLLGNPGLSIASLRLPFTPSNFVVGVGQLDGEGAEEIVIGADGDPGTNTNFLLMLTQGPSSWSTQRVDIGPVRITSVAVGQPMNRISPAIYVGLGESDGSGRIVEWAKLAGVWKSQLVATSTNGPAYVLGIHAGVGVVASYPSPQSDGDFLVAFSATSGGWTSMLFDTNSSGRGLGVVGTTSPTNKVAMRLLDRGGVSLSFAPPTRALPADALYREESDSWYFLTSDPLTWPDAESMAQSYGGHLVSIADANENEFVRSLSTTSAFGEVWIGLNDISVEGRFSWSSGEQVSFLNWNEREPNDLFSNEDFGGLSKGNGHWNDLPPSYSLQGVIEVRTPDYIPALVLPEPDARRTNNWRGSNLESGFVRSGTSNASSVFYAFVDDEGLGGVRDSGDVFVLGEYLLSGTNYVVLTPSHVPLNDLTISSSYGLASVNFLNRSTEVFFTGEPDGRVFAWTATGATNPLQRRLFSSHHAGKAWHALAAVKAVDPGEALVGLRVDPALPSVCDLILWPPQAELPQLVTPPQTAPLATVLPQEGVAATLVPIRIRLWDAEGNASTPFLQYQFPGSTNWQDAAISRLDDAPFSPANKIPALPGGTDHVLTWIANAVFTTPGTTNLWFRVRAQDHTLVGDWSVPMPYSLTIPADIDGDGLPDDWEQANLHTLAYGPGDDPDLDGFTNLQEYLADTDPLVGASHLRITGVSLLPGGLKLDWQGGVEATQILQRNLSVGGADSWLNIHTVAPPTSTSGSYTDVLGTNALQFYRLKVNR